MGIGIRLEELMAQKNTNANELANKIGVRASTIYSIIKRDSNRVDIDIVIKIAHALGMTADEFLSEDPSANADKCPTDKEWSIIEKYRLLDDYGVRTVDAVLGIEYDRCITSASRVTDNVRPIRYYQKTASAGPGQILFDDPAIDRIDIPNTNDYCRVAYAVGVNGDSMEPDYQDGDILLIEPATDLQIGEVGIFYVDGKSYVKKLGDGELISLNPAYDPIPLDVYSRCMGRIIDKL